MQNFKSFQDIIDNKNLLFDIKNDLIFRNVFLNECSFNYVCKLLHYLLEYDLDDLKNNLKLVNNEHPSDSAFYSINRSDIIYDYKGIYIIFEMNMGKKSHHINKNYYYLFKQHSSRLNNKNDYINKTILINFDDYDVNGRNKIVYRSKILDTKYYTNIYNLINILHINLDSLRKKVYNKNELNDLEKLLIIFVEQKKSNLVKRNVEREVIDIMNYIARMDFREGDPVTYNYVEELKIRKELIEEDERRIANEKMEISNEKREISNEKREISNEKREISNEKREISNEIKKLELYELGLEQDKKELEIKKQEFEQKLEQNKQALQEEKLSLAKELKKEGFPIQKILKITKLSEKIVTML